ncbi:nitroreductase family deazaflavin-dependent oxidoreductase [Mycobacterium sp. MMS18-G62]
MASRSRAARVLGRIMRVPSALDRDGTRWALQTLGLNTVIVLVHRGRRSGKLYRTPVEVMVDRPDRGEIVVAPMWGRQTDWYRNVVAGGLVEVHVRGEQCQVEWSELEAAERRTAMDAFRHAHPMYSRMIVRMLVRVNGLQGDRQRAVLREIPMLTLRAVRP